MDKTFLYKPSTLDEVRRSAEKAHIELILAQVKTQTEAARLLGITRRTLYTKIKELGIIC